MLCRRFAASVGNGSGHNVIAPEVLPVSCPMSMVLHLLGGVLIVEEHVVLVVPGQQTSSTVNLDPLAQLLDLLEKRLEGKQTVKQ